MSGKILHDYIKIDQTNFPLCKVVVELVSTAALLEGISTIFHVMFNVELGTE